MNCKIDSPYAARSFIRFCYQSRFFERLICSANFYPIAGRASSSEEDNICAAVDDPEEYSRNIRRVML